MDLAAPHEVPGQRPRKCVARRGVYPGAHDAIIDHGLWDAVQHQLAANRIDHVTRAEAAQPSLLAGLVYDDAGQRMTPSHANKKGRRYRYYVSQDLVKAGRNKAPRGRRVPAGDLESLVKDRLRQFLTSERDLFNAFETQITDARERAQLIAGAADLAERWPGLAAADRRTTLAVLVDRIDLMRETIEIRVLPAGLVLILADPNDRRDWTRPVDDAEPRVILSVPARLKRTGMETRLLIDGAGGGARRRSDRSLSRLLGQAHRYRAMVINGVTKSMSQLAAEAGVTRSYFTRILRLSFLSPEIVTAILRDRHPIELNAKKLANETVIPIAWDEQRALLLTK
jgi:hypothetical protein